MISLNIAIPVIHVNFSTPEHSTRAPSRDILLMRNDRSQQNTDDAGPTASRSVPSHR